MKKEIIKDAPKTDFIVLGGNLDSDKFYGYANRESEDSSDKGFITRTEYGCGRFTIRCVRSLTEGNGWTHKDSESLNEIIRKCIQGGARVFQFDTAKELFDWIFE